MEFLIKNCQKILKMFPKIASYFCIITFGLVVVQTFRIICPRIIGLQEFYFFRNLQIAVIRIYIALSGMIVLTVELIFISLCAILVTTEWIALLYIPLLLCILIWSVGTFFYYLLPMIALDEANEFLQNTWLKFVEINGTLWIDVQIKLRCCGLEGPSSYLEYMRKVHPSCYTNNTYGSPKLITKGCQDVAYDSFRGVQMLATALVALILGLEFGCFIFYVGMANRRCAESAFGSQKVIKRDTLV